jgi:hypothetical protein
VKDWLDSVSKMAFLNGVVDFHFSEDVIQALAHAYHVKFTPIEAVAFFLLVANKMGDDDPDEVREIEAGAQKLVLVTKSDKGYNADLVREQVSRFIEITTALERQPEPSRSAGYVARLSDPLGMA